MEQEKEFTDNSQQFTADQKEKSDVKVTSVNNNQPTANTSQHSTPKPSSHLMIISLAIFILFALGLVAFFYNQNQQLKRMLVAKASPSPAPTFLPTDPLANWKIYSDTAGQYLVKYPAEWQQLSLAQATAQKSPAVFQSADGLYKVTVNSENNINIKTKLPYSTLDEFIGLPYTVKSLTVAGRDARQPLPRAGSEFLNKVYFFSTDNKSIFSIELQVGDGTPTDHRITGETLEIGQDIFNKVISTFKFIISPSASPMAVATCIPRPKCLDENPKCMIPETSEMCPLPSTNPGIACTADVKACPNGGYVGRVGPNCEFAACP